MRIVTTTAVFPPCWDPFNIVDRLSAIGYDSFDMAFDYCTDDKNFPFMTDEYEKWAYTLREYTEKKGKAFTHSHASFDAAYRGEMIERTMKCASILGCGYIVVHPIWHDENGGIDDRERYIRINCEAYKPIIEAGEKYGVAVLSENLLWCASIPAQITADLVSTIASPYFGWCYDTGHAHAMGDSLENFRKVSCPPASLHIHDNDGREMDLHSIPGDGTLDWGDFLRSLKSVGYKGEFVLEAHHQPLDAPDEERDGILARLYERASKMKAYYESL